MANLFSILAMTSFVTLGAVSAHAAGRDKTWQSGWEQSISRPASAVSSSVVVEGRNVTLQARTEGVEPYIANQIEANHRSTH